MDHKSTDKEDGCRWDLCGLASPRKQREHSDDKGDYSATSLEQPQRVIPPKFEPQLPRSITSASHQSRAKSWFRSESSHHSKTTSVGALKHSFDGRSRPSIGRPTDFRRVTEPVPARRRSFRRLELSIYVESTGRLSPLPDFSSDDWTHKLPGLTRPAAALLRRETVDNSELPSEHCVPRKPISMYSDFPPRRNIVSESYLINAENGPGPAYRDSFGETEVDTSSSERTPSLTVPQTEQMAQSQMRTLSQINLHHVRSASPLSQHVRSASGTRSLKGSIRRSKNNDTVEEAIKELNTIVEEKRTRARFNVASPVPLSPTSHIPAVAPHMKLRARSETLQDIGSAFVTSVSTPLPAAPSPVLGSTQASGHPNLSRPLFTASSTHSASSSATALPQMPASNPLQYNPVKAMARKDRFSSWFKHSFPTSPTSIASSDAMPQSFYQIEGVLETGGLPIHHTRDSASFSTISTVTSLDTPRTGSFEASYTPATSIMSPAADGDISSRPSLSKAPRQLRRVPKRGLSIDTTRSYGSALSSIPPAYHELDPHPVPKVDVPMTPSRIGVAC